LKTQLIAEIGQAHDGSLGILHSYIDALAETGIPTIKFQVHIAEAESSEFETFRIPFSYVDKTRKDYWKRMEFSKEQWKEIKNHCEEKKLEFLATPFSIAALELLEELNVSRYKIGSGNITDLLLIDRIAATKKPVILSSGMSDWNELEISINHIKKYHSDISIMQCTTVYPCPPEELGLGLIAEMKSRFNLPVGFSDHSGNIYAGVAAVALGAEMLEFHVCFDKRMFGPDAKASLTIDEVKQLADAIIYIERAIRQSDLKNNASRFVDLKMNFGKSLAVNKVLMKGHIIKLEDLESKKPQGQGISSAEFEKLIGKVLLRDLSKYDFINWSDVG
jgi:N,N'-diacetyllegionaminate synthase